MTYQKCSNVLHQALPFLLPLIFPSVFASGPISGMHNPQLLIVQDTKATARHCCAFSKSWKNADSSVNRKPGFLLIVFIQCCYSSPYKEIFQENVCCHSRQL